MDAATLWRRMTYFKGIPFICLVYAFGKYIERQSDLSLTRYRGKSKLYGREYGPNEKPPWP
uniref:Uncharacterized protein n=1 Tax=Amblyomma maculatum TaxID=34609 RepID=G3MRD0_AMBMU